MDMCLGVLSQPKSERHAKETQGDGTYHNVCEKGDVLVRQLLQNVDLGFKVIEEFGSQD